MDSIKYNQNQIIQQSNQSLNKDQDSQNNFQIPSCFRQIDDLYDDDQASLRIIEQFENLCLEVGEQNPEKLVAKTQNMDLEDKNSVINKGQQENDGHGHNIYLDNKNNKVIISFNKEINCLTITKFFKLEQKEIYEKEVSIIKAIENQGITLPIVGYGVKENQFYYEQVAGQKDFLMLKEDFKNQNQHLFDFFLVKLFMKLDKLHSLGFAHSDIKPQNIVIGFDNEPYLIDFGGAVQCQNYKDYLKQFTPLYNVAQFYEQKEGSTEYFKHNFTSVEEIFYCDRMQLVLSCIYIIYCSDQTSRNIFKQKQFQRFRNENNCSTLLDFLFEFLGLVKQQKNLVQTDKIIKLLQKDLSEDIKFIKDVEIKTQNGAYQCLIKRINQYSIKMIDALVELYGQVTLSDKCTTIYFVPNVRQYQIIYNLYYYYIDYFQGFNHQNIKINLNIYNHPFNSSNIQKQLPQIKPYIYHLSISYISPDESINWIKFHVRYATYHTCKHFNLNKFTIVINSLKDEYIEFIEELDTYNIKNSEIDFILFSNEVEEKYFQLYQKLQAKNRNKYKYLVNYKPDLVEKQDCSMNYVGILSQGEEPELNTPCEGIIKFIRFTNDIKQKKYYSVDQQEKVNLELKRSIFNSLFQQNIQYQMNNQQLLTAAKDDLVKKQQLFNI
ncbi:kinase domain protein (macronuclear) [Tetrahymena thermophila SB210]|uniref:Kinase domain protein n=1 Tax=Tetrahymena thermophila (strain SB210) TaxID=312017 RepID=I7MHI2_TETTS|nr:kinase domain protein [Tetrahymena thermophila SB210]EAR87561.1 kinase domain protein [Tetrahymena thermophila SB210]|eukprot:XP_001007806.1 kinase domain protein [Tetrahymena thermophila SB210]